MQLKVAHIVYAFGIPSRCETLGDSDSDILWCPVDVLGYSFFSRHTYYINQDFYTTNVRVGAVQAAVFVCSKARLVTFIRTAHTTVSVVWQQSRLIRKTVQLRLIANYVVGGLLASRRVFCWLPFAFFCSWSTNSDESTPINTRIKNSRGLLHCTSNL